MNIRKLEDLSKDELIELIKQERETCDQLVPISVEERAALQSQDREDGFSDGVLLALQMMAAAGDAGSHLYCELIETAGLDSIVRRALHEGMWELAGLNDPMSDRVRETINHARRVEESKSQLPRPKGTELVKASWVDQG